MQRKGIGPSKDKSTMTNTQPPWMKHMPPALTGIEAAKAALPIFGGTSTETEESTTAVITPVKTETETSSATSESESTSTESLSPEEIKELLGKVSELSSTVKSLDTQNQSYKAKEEEARKAAMGREEALVEDNERLQQTVSQMDEVIKNLAVINAIQGNKDLQFHDARDVISRLDPGGYELDVDLESRKANVSGIDNELKRIARECPWLVRDASKPGGGSNGSERKLPPRGSGSPPASPTGGDTGKQQKRSALIDKFPVIAHGRR